MKYTFFAAGKDNSPSTLVLINKSTKALTIDEGFLRFGSDCGRYCRKVSLFEEDFYMSSVYYHPHLQQLRFVIPFNDPDVFKCFYDEALILMPVVNRDEETEFDIALNPKEHQHLEKVLSLSSFATLIFLQQSSQILVTLKAHEALIKGLTKALGKPKQVDGAYAPIPSLR